MGIHDIGCRMTTEGHWKLQLILNESTGDHWVYGSQWIISGARAVRSETM